MAPSFQPSYGLGALEYIGEAALFAIIASPIPKVRARNACRPVHASDFSIGILSLNVEQKEVLRRDDISLHANHLGDVGDTP
jgi:hypothetical protein